MGSKTPFVSEIAPDTYAINEFGLAAMYLLVGQKEALLIDTGCGVCDLEQEIRKLTDKPYRVVLTHGHMDHVGGMGAFARVWLHEKDWEMARRISCEELRSYAEQFGQKGGHTVFDYDPKSIQPIAKLPVFEPLHDGDCFDLGGRTVTAISVAGHTAGGVVFLDRKTRILFSGDCCNFNLLALGASVETTLRELEKLKTYASEFDQNFNGHVGFGGSPTCLSQPKNVTDELIGLCRSVLDGSAEPVEYEFLGVKLTMATRAGIRLSYSPQKRFDADQSR